MGTIERDEQTMAGSRPRGPVGVNCGVALGYAPGCLCLGTGEEFYEPSRMAG